MQVSRRQALVLFPSSLAAVYVACRGNGKTENDRVKIARENGGRYLLSYLTTSTDRAKTLRAAYAVTVLGWGDRIRLRNNTGIESLLATTIKDETKKILEDFNARLFISLSRGEVNQSLELWERLLGEVLNNGQIDNDNYLLVNSLILSQELAQVGWYAIQPELTTRLRNTLAANRKSKGWGSSAKSVDKVDAAPITDINAWVVRAGVADKGVLDISQSGPGWRLFVDQSGDQPNVESTVNACWALRLLPKDSRDFILSAQKEDGGFVHKMEERKVSLGATVEAVVLLSLKL